MFALICILKFLFRLFYLTLPFFTCVVLNFLFIDFVMAEQLSPTNDDSESYYSRKKLAIIVIFYFVLTISYFYFFTAGDSVDINSAQSSPQSSPRITSTDLSNQPTTSISSTSSSGVKTPDLVDPKEAASALLKDLKSIFN